jgi:2-dehydropantoate 2-reductase
VGGYFGARLLQAGYEVCFIARGLHLRALQSAGLRLESILGSAHLQPVQATDTPGQVGVVDLVLLAVKAWQVREAAQAMRPLLGPQTVVLPLLNGVEAPEQLTAELGSGPVLGGLCQISAQLVEPGLVSHVGIAPLIALGELDGARSQRTARLVEALTVAGIKVDQPTDIWSALWRKFIFIASVSGVGAVTRAPIGVFRSLPHTRQLLIDALREVLAVGLARGVSLSPDLADATLAFIDGIAPNVMASMQRDILAGRPSELEAQNGAVVRLGSAAGIATPVHAFLYAVLLPQERRARGELAF